jgi:hypothetical protein
MNPKEKAEEVACKSLAYDYNDWVSLFSKDKSTVIYSEVTNWCKGAKYMAERMYSEEEVYELLLKHQSAYRSAVRITSPLDWSFDIKQWFENFKKK